MKQIENIEDIQLLVDTFYTKIREKNELGQIFNDRIEERWPQHLEKMFRFWQTVLLDEHTYYGSPFMPHANLPVDAHHFDRWVELFNETVDSLFFGEKAERAKWQGNRMAVMFNAKINYYRDHNSTPLA